MSIQVSLNGLSFCILNTKDNTIVFYKKITFDKKLTPFTLLDKLKHSFNSIKELKESFAKINVIHENELSTLVPKTLFNEESIADYLKFNSRILQSDYITYDELKTIDSVNVYIPYVNLNNYLYDVFGAFEFNHSSTILLDSVLTTERHSDELKMYVHVAKNHFEIIVIESGKLQLYNSFEYETKEDFIYYILFTAEQLNLNPETFKVNLLGNIEKNDDLYNILYKYVRHVSCLENKSSIKISEAIKNINSNFIILSSF
ncbi:MAG: DUF3822 family protein [Bacteroidia bacterium]|nr:DUF3822 family protein [Bacteroidia bacterium]